MNFIQKTIAQGHALYEKASPAMQVAMNYGLPALVLFAVWWIYNNRNTVNKIALKYVGISEKGDNAGFSDAQFQADMKAAGWRSGMPWCSLFVKMVFEKAYPKQKTKLDTILNASVLTMWNKAKSDTTGLATVSDTPKVGSIVCWKGSSGGHTGIVTAVNGTKYQTVEGNTSQRASTEAEIRNGQGIYNKVGHYLGESSSMQLLGFIVLKP